MSGRTLTMMPVAAALIMLNGCAAYVDDFSSRIDNSDQAYNRAISIDILRNILRAGYAEPTSFVGLGKYTGTSNTSITATVPGFTLSKDPLQIAVSGFSGRGDTNAQIEATVLNTSKFVRGMSTPIDLTLFKAFVDQGYSRELLLHLFVDRIRIADATTGEVTVLRNDPALDPGASCERHDYADYANRRDVGEEGISEYGPFTRRTECEYHRFQYWVEEALRYGFNVDFPETAVRPADGARGGADPGIRSRSTGAPPATDGGGPRPAPGRVCYDLGLMSAGTAKYLLSSPGNVGFARSGTAASPICGSRPTTPRGTGAVLAEALPFTDGQRTVKLRVSLELRSPTAIFRYVGRMAAARSFDDTEMFEVPADVDRRILAIEQGRLDDCYIVAAHGGAPFCVPRTSPNTKATIAILATLVQLNTNRDDLPTNTTTVNISP